ncbi:MAG: DUF2059 domain-containing protein [Candidatus Omnitrophica bacterium]|nr:DUF2059 domain-containing protein [Candidatus Omnitrophota bacterium]
MKTLFTVVAFLFLSSSVFAETIHFKDGRSVNGKVLERTSSEVKVDVNGIPMTYYADELQDIDGNPIGGDAPKAPVITATQIPIATAPVSDNPAEKKALILKFIDVFGTRKAMTRNFETLLDTLAQQKPEDAAKIREGFKIDEVIDRLIPLYDKYFTSEDLKTYIDFYSSEKGQKLISSIGFVMKDSIEVGTAYLKEKFPEIDNK